MHIHPTLLEADAFFVFLRSLRSIGMQILVCVNTIREDLQGTLAGSDVLILTIPWCIGVIVGRCDIDPSTGEAIDGKCSPWTSASLQQQGITLSSSVKRTAAISLITVSNSVAPSAVSH